VAPGARRDTPGGLIDTVDELTEESAGTWWVVTQGSLHFFDLEGHQYMRCQMDGKNAMDGDGVLLLLGTVLTWPKVGGVFRIVLPTTGHSLRQSSEIRAIQSQRPASFEAVAR
jgi:hypothetical protein